MQADDDAKKQKDNAVAAVPMDPISRLRRIVAGVVVVPMLLAGAATLLAFLGSSAWWLDLLTHFRGQYFVCLVIAVLLLLIAKRRKLAAVAAVMAAVNLMVILPLYFSRPGAAPGPATASGPSLRLLQINVNTQHGDPERVAAMIRNTDADFVLLEEVSERWMEALAGVVAQYPHRTQSLRDDNFGIALLSRHPMVHQQTILMTMAYIPTILAEVQTPQGVCKIIGTHTLPPKGREGSDYRNEQFGLVAEHARQAAMPVVLVGDLNCTPWSPHFAKLLEDSDLQDSTRGWGVQPTWPTDAWMVRIPIDHVLHSPGVQITRREVGPDVASDHFPLIVEFRLGGR